MMSIRTLFATASILGSLALAGCGGSDGGETVQIVFQPSVTVEGLEAAESFEARFGDEVINVTENSTFLLGLQYIKPNTLAAAITTPPAGKTCSINDNGLIYSGETLREYMVRCGAPYVPSVVVFGMPETETASLSVQLNSGQILTITDGNVDQFFTDEVLAGYSYNLTIVSVTDAGSCVFPETNETQWQGSQEAVVTITCTGDAGPSDEIVLGTFGSGTHPLKGLWVEDEVDVEGDNHQDDYLVVLGDGRFFFCDECGSDHTGDVTTGTLSATLNLSNEYEATNEEWFAIDTGTSDPGAINVVIDDYTSDPLVTVLDTGRNFLDNRSEYLTQTPNEVLNFAFFVTSGANFSDTDLTANDLQLFQDINAFSFLVDRFNDVLIPCQVNGTFYTSDFDTTVRGAIYTYGSGCDVYAGKTFNGVAIYRDHLSRDQPELQPTILMYGLTGDRSDSSIILMRGFAP